MTVSERQNLIGMTRIEMQSFFVSLGVREFHARQVLQWIYQRGITDFSQMTDLSKALRDQLQQLAQITVPETVTVQQSSDSTRKWLLRFEDGNCIETVFIPEEDRGTLCVSVQVGCSLNCTFCATAKQGFSRNLTTAEIIGQLLTVKTDLQALGYGDRPITNVVMMGMGEPLLNYDAVVAALHLMLDDLSFGMSRRRVTLSTAGIVPAMERLALDCPVSLAVSLHATNNDLRDELVPLNRKYPIEQLLQACYRYVAGENKRHITFEYVMLKGINDSKGEAQILARLLSGLPAKINLIPFNKSPGIEYECSDQSTIDVFREVLLSAGLMTITRRTRGEDIEAACGQLAGRFADRTRRRWKFEQAIAQC